MATTTAAPFTATTEWSPREKTATIRVSGALDESTAPRLAELIENRLRGNLDRVVLDLSGVHTLDQAGTRAITQARLGARTRGTLLTVVPRLPDR
ncbi:STAS domain-containing protein [Amycolatopsis lurida]